MFAPAVIFAVFLGIRGMDSVFLGKTVLPTADVTGGLERNPEMGPDALILPSAVLGGREAMPPELLLAAGGIDIQEQASSIRDPVPPRTLWQCANFPVG
jgi:hypothetical protein